VLIVEIAVHSLLLGVREALLIWSVLVGSVLVPLVTYAYRSRDVRPRAYRPPRVRRPARRERRVTTAESTADLCRYAGEVAVAANRAATTAAYRRAEWLAAQRTCDAAWRAYENACTALRRVERAAAYPLPFTPLSADERAARERYLHRAANAAYRRGDITIEQLIDALAYRNGWDATLHPFEQDLLLRRMGEQRLLRAYQLASTIEREAWQATEIAAAAKRSLDDEAYVAAAQAGQASQLRATANARRRRRTAPALVTAGA
jgi:hypothetical protein